MERLLGQETGVNSDVPLKLSMHRAGIEATLDRNLTDLREKLDNRLVLRIEQTREEMRNWVEATFAPQFQALSARLHAETAASRLGLEESEARTKALAEQLEAARQGFGDVQVYVRNIENRVQALEAQANDNLSKHQAVLDEMQRTSEVIEQNAKMADQATASAEDSFSRRLAATALSMTSAATAASDALAQQATVEAEARKALEDRLMVRLETLVTESHKSVHSLERSLEQLKLGLDEVEEKAVAKAADSLAKAKSSIVDVAAELRQEGQVATQRCAAESKHFIEKMRGELRGETDSKLEAARAMADTVHEKHYRYLQEEAAQNREAIAEVRQAVNKQSDEHRRDLVNAQQRFAAATADVERKNQLMNQTWSEKNLAHLETNLEHARLTIEANCIEEMATRTGKLEQMIKEAKESVEVLRMTCATVSSEACRGTLSIARQEFQQALDESGTKMETLVVLEAQKAVRAAIIKMGGMQERKEFTNMGDGDSRKAMKLASEASQRPDSATSCPGQVRRPSTPKVEAGPMATPRHLPAITPGAASS